jgi:deoxyribodipyrimidine photo-lyase
MAKRSRSISPRTVASSSGVCKANKKPRPEAIPTTFNPNKFATAENAAAVVSDPPLSKLLEGVQNELKNPAKGDSVVYWMRMSDLRSVYHRRVGYCMES